ncbi:MAG: hypothetical protein WC974_01315 [Thermoplasmata archaeon]
MDFTFVVYDIAFSSYEFGFYRANNGTGAPQKTKENKGFVPDFDG